MGLTFFYTGISCLLSPFAANTSFSLLYEFTIFVSYIHALMFRSSALFHWSWCLFHAGNICPIARARQYILNSGKVITLTCFLFAQYCFVYPRILWFHMNFGVSFLIIVGNVVGILFEITLHL